MAEKPPEPAGATPQVAPARGALKVWLPLIITLVAMPVLAFGTMQFLILPKMKAAVAAPAAAEDAAADEGHGSGAAAAEPAAKPAAAHGADPAAGEGHAAAQAASRKGLQMVPLSKMVVNVSGTGGMRYLMASVTLVGTSSKFKTTIEENKDQLLDLALSTLSSKTISDLEKPGARNQMKIELLSVFNNALGESLVKQIYITELAIQ
jgi:flagellar basal body-associated protein FliL